ncbi:AC4 [Deinbollia mosaic virus]|uniref:AC4 n=1 Tax=Deinbollia mosaic virus TaxID=1812308 RepID=A0A142C6K8_9GEMI|nr:AC4 [Deinbollia mosaic virus]AMP46441.1 AC4 [Deinbollia mosaic virus]AMP46459.1 AC4 [Deinbollia mosaic virus]AMP46467.1 AC4 [Deinbollia mosaic virus]
MPWFNSRANTTAQIRDSSTWNPQPGQHITIQTFRELNQAQMSSPISTRTATQPAGENIRSTADLLEEASRILTTWAQRP